MQWPHLTSRVCLFEELLAIPPTNFRCQVLGDVAHIRPKAVFTSLGVTASACPRRAAACSVNSSTDANLCISVLQWAHRWFFVDDVASLGVEPAMHKNLGYSLPDMLFVHLCLLPLKGNNLERGPCHQCTCHAFGCHCGRSVCITHLLLQ
jgi:hypothetical protein